MDRCGYGAQATARQAFGSDWVVSDPIARTQPLVGDEMRQANAACRLTIGPDCPVGPSRSEVKVIYAIRYVDPRYPALAGLTLAFDPLQIAALKARLEHDGYVVSDVTSEAQGAGTVDK